MLSSSLSVAPHMPSSSSGEDIFLDYHSGLSTMLLYEYVRIVCVANK